MTKRIAGFPFWEFAFDAEGGGDAAAQAAIASEVAAEGVTDLFVFSHGWNNDRTTAEILYRGLFGAMRKVVDDAGGTKSVVGVAGVFWPSILWPDEATRNDVGGAASFGIPSSDVSLLDLKTALADTRPDLVADLHRQLSERAGGKEGVIRFGAALECVMSGVKSNTVPEDAAEHAAIVDPSIRAAAMDVLSSDERRDDIGGAAGLGDEIGRLWDGARGALRVATYWTMRNRAGVVGRTGLAPLLDRLSDAIPGLRLHLVGHSFGARLVSNSLAGLRTRHNSYPVKSLFLLQGAFSHFAFADRLPFDATRGGDLKGMSARVDGPLMTTHSLLDLAVGRSYPLASLVARQDASAADSAVDRWGAMGSDGAQGVQARESGLEAVGHRYRFEKGKWLNLDANLIIKNGDPPSGAHSDIIHPEVAWASLTAAGVLR